MTSVTSCPKTQTEVSKAAIRLRCGTDKYNNNQYVCLPNTEKTSLVEMCYDGVMGFYEKGKSSRKRVKIESISSTILFPHMHLNLENNCYLTYSCQSHYRQTSIYAIA